MRNHAKYLLIVLSMIFMYFFTYKYISEEANLYSCDFVEQNIFWHDFSILLKENINEFFNKICHDIYWYNRNPFSIILLLPFSYFIKDFRFGFIYAVEVMYLLPVIMLIWYLFNNFYYKLKEKLAINNGIAVALNKRQILMFLSSIFFFPAIWLSVISGLPDVCGMIPVLTCYIMYFKYGFNKKVNFIKILIFALLLYLPFLSRRWYAVVITSFLASVIVENIYTSLRSNSKIKDLIYTIFNLGIVVLIFSVSAFIIQGGYVSGIIEKELAERSMYTVQYNQIEGLYSYIGILIFLISIIGVICNLSNRLVRVSALNIIIYLFLFIAVMHNQLLWINHFIYIAVLLCILYCAGLYTITKFLKNKLLKNIFIFFIVFFNITNFYTFYLEEKPDKLKSLLPQASAYPIKITDYDKVLNLYGYLENEYMKNKKIKIAIYGLCDRVGYWQFRSINPDGEFAKNAVNFERILDEDFKDADYNEDFVIMFKPFGIFTSEDYSKELKEIEKMFKQNKGFALNYKKVKEIRLENENKTKVTVYKRK